MRPCESGASLHAHGVPVLGLLAAHTQGCVLRERLICAMAAPVARLALLRRARTCYVQQEGGSAVTLGQRGNALYCAIDSASTAWFSQSCLHDT